MRLLTCYFITTIMGCVAARIVSHTYTHTHTQNLSNILLGSAQTAFTWHDGRYARLQMDRGGADSCTFDRGGAESTTFDLTIDNRQQIPNSYSCLLER